MDEGSLNCVCVCVCVCVSVCLSVCVCVCVCVLINGNLLIVALVQEFCNVINLVQSHTSIQLIIYNSSAGISVYMEIIKVEFSFALISVLISYKVERMNNKRNYPVV